MRGHDKKLVYDGFNRDIRKFSFTSRTIKIWNSLPQNVVDSPTVHQFETKLDEHWISQPVYFDNFEAEIEL